MRWLLFLFLLAGCTAGGSSEQEHFSRGEALRDHFASGTYSCRKCERPLYQSDDKRKVEARWPVFSGAVPDAVRVKKWEEEGKTRFKVSCGGCHLHLGYLCEDGKLAHTPEAPDHCILSSSLRFQENK